MTSSQGTMTEIVGYACRRRSLQGRPDPRQAVRNGKRTPRVTSAVLAALAASFLASAKAFTAVPQLLHLRHANLQARGPRVLGRCRCSGVARLPAQKDVTDDDLDIPRPDTPADLTPGYECLELDDEIDWEFLEKMERNSKYMMPPIDPLFLRYDHERFREYYEEQPMLLLGRALATASGVLKVLAAVGADIIGGGLTPIDAAAGRAELITDVLGALGPTYNKFGQALSSRPDLVGPELAIALSRLQDDLDPFPAREARRIIRADIPDKMVQGEIIGTMSTEAVAAGSLGVVYKAKIDRKEVAVKLLRPGILETVAADSVLLRAGAAFLAGLRWPNGEPLVKAQIVDAVDEFAGRLFEESDYANEARNILLFKQLYNQTYDVVVPAVVPEGSHGRVLSLEWINGTKLVEPGNADVDPADLPLLSLGIQFTLAQLLDEGVMHADPHPGNLLKSTEKKPRLVYLDFGLVARIPEQVRTGLIRAVAYLVAEEYDALASLFGDLMLLPQAVLDDPARRAEFTGAIEAAAQELLPREGLRPGEVPRLNFDRLIQAIGGLATGFSFTLPPYFLNNARAIGTLEGLAKSADPDFNVLAVVYAFALRQLLNSKNPELQRTLRDIAYDPVTGRLNWREGRRLLKDAAAISGLKRRRIMWDSLKTRGGRAVLRQIVRDEFGSRWAALTGRERRGGGSA